MKETGLIIKFNPEKIRSVAIDFKRQQERFIELLESMGKESEMLTNIWRGESCELYMDKFRKLDMQGRELAKLLLGFGLDLEDASGIYEQGEMETDKRNEGLPIEGVFKV